MTKKKNSNRNGYIGLKNPGIFLTALLLVIFLPILFSTKTIDPVLSIRMLALNIFLVILGIFWYRQARQKYFETGYLKTPVFLFFLAYLLITGISITISINPVEGYFDLSKTFLSLQIVVLVTGFILAYEQSLVIITKAAIINSIIAAMVGIAQYFYFTESNTGAEYFANLYNIGGLMGHKNQFAISLFLLLPFATFGVMAFEKRWWYVSLFSLVLILVNIALLQTRSVWLAFWTSIIVFSILVLVYTAGNLKSKILGVIKKRLAPAISIIFAVTIILFFVQPPSAREVYRYKIISMINVKSHHNLGRIESWTATTKMIAEHPLAGVGAGNWKIHLPEYYSNYHSDDYKNWHQPHNDFLWILSEKGFVGLLIYLAIFFLIFRAGFLLIKRTENITAQLFYMIITATLAGYLVIAFVDFPYERINHQVMLMIFFSLIIAGHYKLKKEKTSISKRWIVNLSISSLLLLGMSLYFGAKNFETEKEIKRLYAAIESDNVAAVLNHAALADNSFYSLDHNANPVRMHRGTALLRLNRHDESLDFLLSALSQHPNHPNILNNIATVFAIMGNYQEAIKYFERSLQLFPRNQLTIRSLARAYSAAGNDEQALQIILLHNTNNDNPQYFELKEQIERRIDDK